MHRDNGGSRRMLLDVCGSEVKNFQLKKYQLQVLQRKWRKRAQKGKKYRGRKKKKSPQNKKRKKICNISWFFCLNIIEFPISCTGPNLSCGWNCRIVTDRKFSPAKIVIFYIADTLQQALSFRNNPLKLNVLLLPFIREQQPARPLCSFPGVPADITRHEQVMAH